MTLVTSPGSSPSGCPGRTIGAAPDFALECWQRLETSLRALPLPRDYQRPHDAVQQPQDDQPQAPGDGGGGESISAPPA